MNFVVLVSLLQLLLKMEPCCCSLDDQHLFSDALFHFFTDDAGDFGAERVVHQNIPRSPSFPFLSPFARFKNAASREAEQRQQQQQQQSHHLQSPINEEEPSKLNNVPPAIWELKFTMPYFYLLKIVNSKFFLTYPSSVIGSSKKLKMNTEESVVVSERKCVDSVEVYDEDEDDEFEEDEEDEEDGEDDSSSEDTQPKTLRIQENYGNKSPEKRYKSPTIIRFPQRKTLFKKGNNLIAYLFQEYKHFCLRTGCNMVNLILSENKSDKTYIIPSYIRAAFTTPGGPLNAPNSVGGAVSIVKDSPDWTATSDLRSNRCSRGRSFTWDERLHFNWASPTSEGTRLHYPIIDVIDVDSTITSTTMEDNSYKDAWYRYLTAINPWNKETIRHIGYNGVEKGYYQSHSHKPINLVRLYDDPFSVLVTEPEYNHIFMDLHSRKGLFRDTIVYLREHSKKVEKQRKNPFWKSH